MYIGELAKRAGATPKAVRLYESLGLLGVVGRAGHGFKLAEVLPTMTAGEVEPNWATMTQQVEKRRAEIAHEFDRLRELDAQLQEINIEIRACAELA